MSTPQDRPRVPNVNLLSPPARGLRLPIPSQLLEVGLIAFVVLVWAVAAVGIAVLLGWHPHLGSGP